MRVKCPSCNTEYDCEPGRYQCGCGTKFSVAADGSVTDPEFAAGTPPDNTPPDTRTAPPDLDMTIPPQRGRQGQEDESEIDVTMPGKRERKSDGRFGVGDVILGRYRVLSELGQGGMGVVYKCFDDIAGIMVALKALPPELSHSEPEMEDVKNNFQLVHKLHHPNIASSNTLERDNSNGNYYLIMECVEGEDLRRWIRRKRNDNALTLETILPIIRQIASALDYAHEEMIIHRDIKPGNIMIDAGGHVKVLDFGLAAQIHTSMTRVSMVSPGTGGTAPYMAPEQWRGQAQGGAADQYALGVMVYELLAGRLPFESTDVIVLREAVLNEMPNPVVSQPKHVQAAIERALSKDPAKRFDRCSDFVDALEGKAVKPALQKGAKPNLQAPEEQAGRRRWSAVFLLVGVVLIVAAGLFIFITFRKMNSSSDAQPSATSQKSAAEPSADSRTIAETQPVADGQVSGDERLALDDTDDTDGQTAVVPQNPAASQKPADKQNSAASQKPAGASGSGQSSLSKKTINLSEEVSLEMVKVDPGTFKMNSRGSGWNESNEKPHEVTLTQVYYIGRTEVTQTQWYAITGKKPSRFTGEDLPVEQVSWNDAMAFCAQLNEMNIAPTGWKFSLPTEAQWEFAARGGDRSRKYKYSGSDDINKVAWCMENSGDKKMTDSSASIIDLFENNCSTHPVKQKSANELGLYDMSGNVFEWCLDDYVADNSKSPVEFTRKNDRDGGSRTVKGGAWNRASADCSPAGRFAAPSSKKDIYIGFRLVLVRDSGEKSVKQMLKDDSRNNEQNVRLPGGVQLKMVKVRAGSFEMSAGDGENKAGEAAHRVTLNQDFYIGQTEVTQAQWNTLMENNPSVFKGDDLPVENVSWDDAIEFCGKLYEKGIAPEGYIFVLPTEAQWEYAARGGREGRKYKYSGSNKIDEVAWFDSNSGGKTHPVKQKKANELGLYDMSGNVREWCLDQFVEDSRGAKAEFPPEEYLMEDDQWKENNKSLRQFGLKMERIMSLRGGSWSGASETCRSACRDQGNFDHHADSIGFRLALVPVTE